MGFPILDPVASIVICLFILKVAIDIFRDAIGKMTDTACSEEFEAAVRGCIREEDGVLGIDLLQTRKFGEKVYVDVEIAVDGTQSLYEAHNIAESVHHRIEESFPSVKHVMVHVNPAGAEN